MLDRISEIIDREAWEDFVLSRPEANFLQSWNWGEFQARLGKKVFRLGLIDQSKMVGGALVVKEEAKRGWYLSIAGGPLVGQPTIPFEAADQPQLNDQAQDYLRALLGYIKELAQKERCSFVRIRPQLIETEAVLELAAEAGLRLAPMHLTADLTLQLDLRQPTDALLADMRKNTRYEVRKADKLGITVRQTQDPAEIDDFYKHQVALAERHRFVPFSYDFLKTQFEVFAEDDQAALFHAYQGDKLLASAFILFYNQEAVYHYGVSTADNTKLPGSYAAQWAAIKAAQERGCVRYNFWGIAPVNQPDHRFAGVSLFKRGFGGQEVAYLPAHDLPTSWQYGLTFAVESLRKKMRKL